MNFFVNMAMGIGNSGVEHAEFYRARRFAQAELPYRFIFLSLIPELHQAMSKWKLAPTEVINIWEYLVLGSKALNGLKPSFTPQDTTIVDMTKTNRRRERVTDTGIRIIDHFVKYPDLQHPESKVLLVSTARTELYDEQTHERKVMYSYQNDPHQGSVITNIHLYHEQGRHLFFPNLVDLYRYFFQQLLTHFGKPSNFLIDRGENVDEALVRLKSAQVHLIYIVHADHLSDRQVARYPLWNNHYEYLLTHLDLFDRVVVATDLQRFDLLHDFPRATQQIVTIPVGGITAKRQSPRAADWHQPFKLITASRLAQEKNLDLAIEAVAQVVAAGHPIQFDIYGQGGEKKKLSELIEQYHAEKFITLKGLSDHLDQVYPEYDAFISASFSEGFGLTYIEALNAGLPVVTFDARFGAQELIQTRINGFLQPFNRENRSESAKSLARGLHELIESSPKIYETTATVLPFQDQVIAKKWRELIHALSSTQ